MSATAAMEVNAEARRILAVSISKLYASRTQRGGLRLHRSLLLSLVMRSARDIYHSSRESEAPSGPQPTPEEPMDTGSSSSGEEAELPEPQPEPKPALSPAEPPTEEPDSAEEGCDSESTEDKENLSPARQSRKRRGKASAAPDFLPSKRARLEPGEERYAAPLGSCRAGVGESLTALSLNRVIPAF
ncbi:immediate early response gene 2 protein [Seriola lalandi dorsalis]|uniref:immediate early response gene 2 protein n=1 Tax=Seriola dumerili TaxID=41447 RepID=UPI000BBE939F|nr:immediate early response gene 2 protein [Seriola dumerili]XP_023266056.1 immediate early response gene 2 protein [Seriola lalandi dorsalis]XP_056228918.1 immediate early response 2b [Seriola aureovittata]